MRKPTLSLSWLEGLEDRALLSHILPRHPLTTRPAIAAGPARPVSVNSPSLQGTARGNYTITPSRQGVAANYQLSGAGTLNSLGNLQVNGVITVTYVRNRAVRTGSITLTGAQGTIRLRVQGTVGVQPLAPVGSGGTSGVMDMPLRYTIQSGTGVYRNLKGSGNLDLGLTPRSATVPPSGNVRGTGTGTRGTLSPAPTPSTSPSIPPTTPPGKVGTPPGRGTLPPIRGVPTPVGGPVGLGGGQSATNSVTPTPVGGPTFLSGTFTITFNDSPTVWPPML